MFQNLARSGESVLLFSYIIKKPLNALLLKLRITPAVEKGNFSPGFNKNSALENCQKIATSAK